MELINKLGERAIKKEGEGYFLLTDKSVGYISLGSPWNISHMQGLFHMENNWQMYKSLDNIYPDREITCLENGFDHVIRKYGDSSEIFHLSPTALIYEMKNYEGYINLDVDFREMFDFDESERAYRIEKDDDLIIICFEKHKRYLAIKGIKDYEPVERWEKREYPYDRTRNDKFEFYVYKALRIKCNEYLKLFMSFSEHKKEAVEDVKSAFRNESTIKEALHLKTKNLCRKKNIAVNAAINSLDSLRTTMGKGHNKLEALFAGLPWFHQFWSRDELISLGGFIVDERFNFVKTRLMSWLNDIKEDGRLANMQPKSEIGSADSIGWLFKRFYDLIKILEKKGCLKDYFTKDELMKIKHKLHFCIEEHMVRFMHNRIIYNEPKETWMDTDSTETNEKDNREGACIEIQALFLSSFKLMNILCKHLDLTYVGYGALEKLFVKEVRKNFFKNTNLLDRLGDETIRPNIFIAYYVYPELLRKHEWMIVFNKALRALWLEWGGLTSIDKSHKWFKPYYTGVTNFSYHRGDSWFWINNLAAICMHDLNKEKYKHFIDNIYSSSEQEMLFSGFIGHCAEISSAAERRSEGCMAQAWSAATFIELADKLKDL